MSDAALHALVAKARKELPYQLSSFEQLVQLQYKEIHGFALRLVHDYDEADSVTQDVLIRVLHGLPKLAETEKFRSWVKRITINAVRSRKAREKRKQEVYSALAEETSGNSDDCMDEQVESLSTLLEGLSIEEKSIVVLKINEDLEFADIAQIVDLKISAVKMRYYRALEKIKHRLSQA